MQVWTKIPKATGTAYTKISPGNGLIYDDSSIIYDSPITPYDGSALLWTKIPKATGGLTWDQDLNIWFNELRTWDELGNGSTNWIKISKAT